MLRIIIKKVNHIQNISILANKSRLVTTIKDFELKNKQYDINSNEFLPETFRLDCTSQNYSHEESLFLNKKSITGIWINKPTNFNCGRGISIISDVK